MSKELVEAALAAMAEIEKAFPDHMNDDRADAFPLWKSLKELRAALDSHEGGTE